MTVEYCEHCDLIIGAGCPGHAVKGAKGPAPDAGHVTWPAGTILISPARVAHRPGCGHLTESLVQPPEWGWTIAPEGAWDRISAGTPLRATAGNTRRTARRRCSTCDAA